MRQIASAARERQERKRGEQAIDTAKLGHGSSPVAQGLGQAPSSPRRIVILVYPKICALDTVGPLEAFAMANDLAQQSRLNAPLYDLAVVAVDENPLPTSVGFMVTPTCGIDRLELLVDTLLVSGGEGRDAASKDERLTDFLRRASRRARRLGSVCTGAFPLAAAGLLDGRQATTHWARAAEFQRLYPKVKVQADRIFIRDGNMYTSAGISAGIDLALALIEEDHGRALSLNVARALVVPFKRTGGQTQFSMQLQGQFATTPTLQRVLEWAAENLGTDLSLDALAARAGMSRRNFSRLFREVAGVTPTDFVVRLRVEKVRQLLEDTSQHLQSVATQCGFHSLDSMRRVFVEHVGSTPAHYRKRFSNVPRQVPSPIVACR
jgi:transcriptional regulator GlxA family with amidase domain